MMKEKLFIKNEKRERMNEQDMDYLTKKGILLGYIPRLIRRILMK